MVHLVDKTIVESRFGQWDERGEQVVTKQIEE